MLFANTPTPLLTTNVALLTVKPSLSTNVAPPSPLFPPKSITSSASSNASPKKVLGPEDRKPENPVLFALNLKSLVAVFITKATPLLSL